MNTYIKDIVELKRKELNSLLALYVTCPDARIEFTAQGSIYTSSEMNKLVDSLEVIIPNEKFAFYRMHDNVKIYADPYAVTVKTSMSYAYELDWLSSVITINPVLLVQLMEKINSKYIHSLYYYEHRYPQLAGWINAHGTKKSNQNSLESLTNIVNTVTPNPVVASVGGKQKKAAKKK
jgi:hypothetical protein